VNDDSDIFHVPSARHGNPSRRHLSIAFNVFVRLALYNLATLFQNGASHATSVSKVRVGCVGDRVHLLSCDVSLVHTHIKPAIEFNIKVVPH
jgi:hypothetical protein